MPVLSVSCFLSHINTYWPVSKLLCSLIGQLTIQSFVVENAVEVRPPTHITITACSG